MCARWGRPGESEEINSEPHILSGHLEKSFANMKNNPYNGILMSKKSTSLWKSNNVNNFMGRYDQHEIIIN